MITFENGYKISNFCIDTAFGLGGGGMFPYYLHKDYRFLLEIAKETKTTIFTKSATWHKRNGNFHLWKPWTWKYIQRIEKFSMLNAYGLTNPGVQQCAPFIKYAVENGFQVIPSYCPDFYLGFDTAFIQMIAAIDEYKKIIGPYFRAIEKNDSCPNSGEDIEKTMEYNIELTRAIKKYLGYKIALIDKVSVVHPYSMVQELAKPGGADAIHAINAIPYHLVKAGKSPLEKVGGGAISGLEIFDLAKKYNKTLNQMIDIPIIYSGGIINRDCICSYAFAKKNQSSFSSCTIAIRNTKDAISIIKDLNKNSSAC